MSRQPGLAGVLTDVALREAARGRPTTVAVQLMPPTGWSSGCAQANEKSAPRSTAPSVMRRASRLPIGVQRLERVAAEARKAVL